MSFLIKAFRFGWTGPSERHPTEDPQLNLRSDEMVQSKTGEGGW